MQFFVYQYLILLFFVSFSVVSLINVSNALETHLGQVREAAHVQLGHSVST